ncbi:MAG TPA: M14 family metallopeptidase, partial [Candidatus Ozemobacteraceae bacterium]|nr:M14 family metallopeptidase [Candidatus Ozemobacteraceae bacterium]
ATASYYTYDTMLAQLQEWAAAYPQVTQVTSIGKSIEGREIWALKVSDNPAVDELEPACLLVGGTHAREWIGVEVAMAALQAYLEGYSTDEKLTRLVNEREVWFVPMLNPDGILFSQNSQRYWRKNRRPAGSSFGVDLNRNFGYKWGLTGASDKPYSDTYHGAEPFSEPETRAVKELAERERFQTSLAFHSYSELILYPFAYGYNAPNPDEAVYKDIGGQMAKFNKYKVQNCTELYPAMGISDDWLYGDQKTIALTFELAQEFIPPPQKIAAITAATVPAVLLMIEKTAAIAVNNPSGETAPTFSLDTTDGLEALAMGQRLMTQVSGFAREMLAARLQSTVRQVATVATDNALSGNSTSLTQVRQSPAAPLVMPQIRSRLRFEACHGRSIPSAIMELVVPGR